MMIDKKGNGKIAKICLSILFIAWLGMKMSYAEDIYGGKSDQEILKNYVQNWLGEDPVWEKYIYNVIYVGMPEDEFVKLFTWNKEFEGTLRPYIVKDIRDIYYFIEPEVKFMKKYLKQSNIANTGKARVKFKDGLLVKYESQYWGKPPFVFLIWGDLTTDLKNKSVNFQDRVTAKE